jgi:hypothetical protein
MIWNPTHLGLEQWLVEAPWTGLLKPHFGQNPLSLWFTALQLTHTHIRCSSSLITRQRQLPVSKVYGDGREKASKPINNIHIGYGTAKEGVR